MTVSDDKRKVGINVSIPFKYIEIIDKKATDIGKRNRSGYIWSLIKKDLGLQDRD